MLGWRATGRCLGALALRRGRGRRWQAPWWRKRCARSRSHRPGDGIPFRVHTLGIGDVILGLTRRGGDSDLVLRIGPALGVLGLEDVHGLACRREREYAGGCWDAGTGAQEAEPEE
jgi:hypothetical protein